MKMSRTEAKSSLKGKAKKEVVVEEDGEEEEEEEEEEGVGLGFGDDEKKKRVMDLGKTKHVCQAEKCTADLRDAKVYHRRHKVCEHHAKASVVLVAGFRQRFCQQCSRFHELSEFDEAKRSCRRRLAGHNERRRKNSSESHGEGSSRKGVDPHLKENHCRQADERGRIPTSLPGNATYKHFQIR